VKTFHLYLLSLLSGLLLAFAWFPLGWVPLLFIGFVPLLLIEKQLSDSAESHHSLTLIGCCCLAFFTWNLLTTWWIKNASYSGVALAIGCNTLLMTTVFLLFHRIKKQIGEKWKYVIFCSFWMTWEFFHLRWDLSWPWLTLGNAFANTPRLIQWYEYTGVFGGSLWVLMTNCIVASCFTKTARMFSFRPNIKKIIGMISLVLAPVIASCIILNFQDSALKAKGVDVVVIQPNIDPYKEKFTVPVEKQVAQMLKLAGEKVDSNTAYVIFPETALPQEIWETEWVKDKSIVQLNTFLKRHPNLKIIIGASTSKFYEPDEERSSTARKFTEENAYYDVYNTALQLDTSGNIQVYHKSKLVPGVEKLPFPFLLKSLNHLTLDLGGTTGSLGVQEDRAVFISNDSILRAAPVICYESIYGEYVCGYIKNGADFIAILTNDGWWGDTPGYKQHLKYASLRAIETRRWVVRSANTGISCFITPEGEIQQATDWWVPAAIKGEIHKSNTLTFYTKHGDYIARTAMSLSLLLIIYSGLIRFKIVKK
jgi:apolipoprotein N-acyltransferase